VCRLCVQKWIADRHVRETARRADEGTRVHDVAEWWSYHGEIKDHDADIAPYVKSFQEFVADYGVTPTTSCSPRRSSSTGRSARPGRPTGSSASTPTVPRPPRS
jgi:hypothetical protein